MTERRKKKPEFTLKPTAPAEKATPDITKSQEQIVTAMQKGTTINANDLERKEVLGKGQYGVVYRVIHKPTDRVMALKEIQFANEPEALRQILRELDVLISSKSPYLVQFYGSYIKDTSVYYCMEYMDCGSLDKLYKGGVPEEILAKIAISMVRGLKYMKDDLKIIHRDVKPTNVLANRVGEIKLCDFGISGELVQSVAQTYVGSSSYMAPERINPTEATRTYDVRSDVWSLGVSLVEIGNGQYPFQNPDNNIFAQLKLIVDGEPPKLNSSFSADSQDFVKLCLSKGRDERPTYDKLLEHRWLKKYDNEKVDLVGWLASRVQKT
jgi:mitogen-activated protein kinase kinase